MKDTVYSEKEIAIFEGIITLMGGGANPYSIKVSDIAKSANMGKGTMYDYFTSKEEAISKAILYNISNEIDASYIRIKAKGSFRDKFYEVLYILTEGIGNSTSTFNMLSSAGGIEEFYEYVLDRKGDIYKYIERVNHMVGHLLEVGIREGVIVNIENSYYREMVIKSGIIGFSQYLGQRKLYKETSMEEAMESAYKLVIKGLNP